MTYGNVEKLSMILNKIQENQCFLVNKKGLILTKKNKEIQEDKVEEQVSTQNLVDVQLSKPVFSTKPVHLPPSLSLKPAHKPNDPSPKPPPPPPILSLKTPHDNKAATFAVASRSTPRKGKADQDHNNKLKKNS